MKLKAALLLLLGGLFVIGASLITKPKSPATRTLPASEPAQELSVAGITQATSSALVKDANPDWIGAIDRASAHGSADQLVNLFSVEGLPATAKAHLIEAALQRQDSQLLHNAQSLLHTMVESGTVADVLAAIPKVAYFTEDTAKDIVAIQEKLCRFQSSREDEFGFEMIKVKFNMVLGKEPNVKPWTAVCGAS